VSRLTLLHPTSLLGKELLEALAARPDLTADLHLLSIDEDEVGQLTEAVGSAAFVAAATPEAVEAADVLVVCGELAPYRELLAARRPDAGAVLLSPDAVPDDGPAVVAGVNLEAARRGEVMVSPHPGAILLAHLLHPLRPHGLAAAVASLVQPVSVYDRPGLDELFEQAGRMVAMQTQAPSALFGGRQLAFNLYPAPRPPRHLLGQVRSVLGDDAGPDALPLAVSLLQGPVFHGFAAHLHVEMADDVEAGELRAWLAENPLVELFEPEEGDLDQLGPIDVPAHDRVLVGPVERDPAASGGRGTGFWIWAVMDNLTRGGAANALAILEQIL
jgi:aspartate-semialdehyde dehydrogenase